MHLGSKLRVHCAYFNGNVSCSYYGHLLWYVIKKQSLLIINNCLAVKSHAFELCRLRSCGYYRFFEYDFGAISYLYPVSFYEGACPFEHVYPVLLAKECNSVFQLRRNSDAPFKHLFCVYCYSFCADSEFLRVRGIVKYIRYMYERLRWYAGIIKAVAPELFLFDEDNALPKLCCPYRSSIASDPSAYYCNVYFFGNLPHYHLHTSKHIQEFRVFHITLERVSELYRFGAIDNPVVERHCKRKHLSDNNCTVPYYWHVS